MKEKVLTVKNLVTQFRTEQGIVTAVNGVSFDVYPGKTLGIVGESGSGKSVTALSIMRLITGPIGNIAGGEIWLGDQDLCQLSNQAMRTVRGGQLAMIFQEPMTSLNPVFTIGYQISEALVLHQPLTYQEANEQAIELLSLVGIPAPARRIQEYPHQLSGGMQQRAMIAMALAGKPTVLIADEPTTALDVTIQAQILDLLMRLQEEMGMGIIFITHDLGVVAEVCHEVAVMYAGKIVEQGPVQTLLNRPKHPYTQGLLNAIPVLEPTQDKKPRRLATIRGVVPALNNLPPGCSFQDRCHKVQPACRGEQGPPPLEEKSPAHWAACFYPID